MNLTLSALAGLTWSFDFANSELGWMPGMDALLGMPGGADEDVRTRLWELVEPLTVAATTAGAWHELDLEQRIVAPDGETRYLHFHARPLDLERGRVVVGLVRDITATHRDRRALADLAERYRLLVDLSPDVILVHQDEVIRYANRAAGTILGAESSTDLVGRPVTDVVASHEVGPMRERIRSLTEPGAATPRSRADLQTLDGAVVPVELVSVHTTWEGREALQVIAQDVTSKIAAEAALRYQAALVEHVNDAIIATNGVGEVTSWNPAAEAVYGLPAEQALGHPVADLVGADLQLDALVTGDPATEARHRHRDGTALRIRISAATMDSGYVLVCADETARRRAEQDFATVVAALDEGIYVIGPAGRIESANPAAQHILGISETQLIGSSPAAWTLFDETGAELALEDYPSLVTQRTGQPQNSRVLRLQRPDGTSAWLSATSRALNPQDRPPHIVATSFTDITETRAAQERLEHQATHDPLTGLANRTLVLRHLEQSPQRTQPVAVLFLDLDNFKIVNDSLGHRTGDEVLRTVGQRLVRATRRGKDLVGRLGGDEFVVIAHAESDPHTLGALGTRLLDALAEPVEVAGRQLHVSGSIGVLVSGPDDTRVSEDILRDADVAMYRAKSQGGNRYALFDVAFRERVQRHMALEHDLRHATQHDQLWLAYQPILDLRSGRTTAVEGLLRWTHPVHGLVSPGEFIPLAEESDLINSIGAHMLRTATRQLAAERQRRGLDLHLNANLSPRQLEDPDLPELVQQALAHSGLPAHALCLEITENAIMQGPTAMADVLHRLRELGARLAIDDFGTGYSSLAQLRQLPVDTLKIDRSFVNDLGDAHEAEALITSIIAMAHALGLDVVAEGIETPQQLALLRDTGCDHAQGFYLGKPVPIDQLATPQHLS